MTQPRDVFDDDGLAAVDDADGFHADRAARPRLDRAHRNFEGLVRHGAIKVFAYLLDLDTEGVADQPELARPLAGDRARE